MAQGFPAYTPAPGLPAQAPIDLAPLQKLLAAAPNTKGLAKTAAAQAAQQVNAQLSAIHAAQQGDLQQAAGRAQQIGTLSQDAAHFLDKLGFAERLRAALEQAGQDQATFAQGFSGDLRHTAEQDAAKVQQSLAAIGAPGQVQNADALANTVYGLGRIPADVLTASAPYVYAQAQTLPASLLAAGREQAVGALGAGQQAAARYQPQIAEAVGSLPKLTQGILSDLTSAAEKARQDAIGNMFKAVQLQQDGRTAEATQAWRNAQLQGEQWKTYTAAYNHWVDAQNTAAYRDQTAQGRADALAEERSYHKALAAGRTATLQETQAHNAALERIAAKNAATSRIRANKPPSPIFLGTDATGKFSYDPETGALTKLPGPLGKPRAPSATSLASLSKAASKQAKIFYEGLPQQHVSRYDTATGKWVHDVVPGTGQPPVLYPDAKAQLLAMGPPTTAWERQVTRILNALYAPGVGGRPLSKQQRANQAVAHGAAKSIADAFGIGIG